VAERGLAPREIVRQLRAKGIDGELAAASVDHIDRDMELATARELVRRKLRTMSRLDDAAKSRRLVGLLARKGYSSGVSYSVVRDALHCTEPFEE
jgi:regulatory protein